MTFAIGQAGPADCRVRTNTWLPASPRLPYASRHCFFFCQDHLYEIILVIVFVLHAVR